MNRAALALSIFICLLPVLGPPDFPTQDGPSHLHNAAVLLDYSSTPIYQQYYERRITLAGNVLTQPLVMLLQSVMPTSAAAGKAVSVIVVAAFPLAFAWLLSAYTTQIAAFTIFGSLCALNFFVQMGFWNFSYGVVLLLVALGWAARGRNVWGIAAFSLALYFSHPLAWAVFGLYCGMRALETRRFLPLLAHAPGAVLFLVYMSHAGGARKEFVASWSDRLWPIYSLSFLHTSTNTSEPVWALAVCFVFILILAAARRRPDALAATAAVCLLGGVFLPPYMNWEAQTYVGPRMAMFAFLLLVAWCGGRSWSQSEQRFLGALALLLLSWGAAIRFQLCRQWSEELAAYTQVFSAIRPGSTVLAVRLEGVRRHYSPTLHAIGLLAPRPFVDLRNYEAATDHFVTSFRPEYSPFPALGKQMDLERPMPRIDIARYERETKGRVDYLLFEGAEPKETTHYASELKRFRLVASGPRTRLYFGSGASALGP